MNKIENEHSIEYTLPLLPLYPQQQIIYDSVMNDEKKYVAIGAHRRLNA